MRKGPTKKQTTLLQFIADYTEEHNFSPSYREIMTALNLRSVSAVAEHISNCVAAGYLEKIPGQARSLRVIPPENHDETINFINKKISSLDQELISLEDAENSEKNLVKIQTIHEQIATLRSAAEILEIEL